VRGWPRPEAKEGKKKKGDLNLKTGRAPRQRSVVVGEEVGPQGVGGKKSMGQPENQERGGENTKCDDSKKRYHS